MEDNFGTYDGYKAFLASRAFNPVQAERTLETVKGVEADLAAEQGRCGLADIKNDLGAVEANLRHEIKGLELRLVIKLGAMMAATVALVAALDKVL